MKRRAFSLIELLSVVGISVVLCSMSARLFCDGLGETHRIRRQAEAAQLVMVVMERWQDDVNRSNPGTWRTGADGFTAGAQCRIAQEGRHLVFTRGPATSRIALPAGMTCAFSTEKTTGFPDTAVLIITMPTSGRHTPETVRIVSCGGIKTP